MYSPAITDFTLMVDKKSHMFITGPDVIKTVTKGEEVSKEVLGGAHTHNSVSGVAHFLSNSDQECKNCRELLSYIPQNNVDRAPRKETSDGPVVEIRH